MLGGDVFLPWAHARLGVLGKNLTAHDAVRFF